MSASASLICKILAVFLLFCLAKASGGTCLSYGHSCWGGHGKRNGLAHAVESTASQKHTRGWYLSRLLNPSTGKPKNIENIFKNQDPEAEEVDSIRQYGYQMYPGSDTSKENLRGDSGEIDGASKPPQWGSEVKESEEEVVLLTPGVQRMPISKFQLYQLMNQEGSKGRSEN